MHNNNRWQIIIRWNISIDRNLEFQKWNGFMVCIELKDFRWDRFVCVCVYFDCMSVQWRKSCPILCLSSRSFSVNWSTKFIFSILLLWNFESEQCFHFYLWPNGIANVHFECLTNHLFQICWLDQANIEWCTIGPQPLRFLSHILIQNNSYFNFEIQNGFSQMIFKSFAFCVIISVCVAAV